MERQFIYSHVHGLFAVIVLVSVTWFTSAFAQDVPDFQEPPDTLPTDTVLLVPYLPEIGDPADTAEAIWPAETMAELLLYEQQEFFCVIQTLYVAMYLETLCLQQVQDNANARCGCTYWSDWEGYSPRHFIEEVHTTLPEELQFQLPPSVITDSTFRVITHNPALPQDGARIIRIHFLRYGAVGNLPEAIVTFYPDKKSCHFWYCSERQEVFEAYLPLSISKLEYSVNPGAE